MEHNKIIERFAEVQGITYEEAEQRVGAETDEEILNNIENFTKQTIIANNNIKLNRAQRRALQKKLGKKNLNDVEIISDTAQKLNYIDLIQKLKKLNEEQENKNDETVNEDN